MPSSTADTAVSGSVPTSSGQPPPSSPHPQRLILLCDGTWDDSFRVSSTWRYGSSTSKPMSGDWWTNPALLNFAIPPLSRPDSQGKQWRQICYYLPGIGSQQASLFARLFTGATGAPLVNKVQEAYSFLCNNYQAGDEICIFGFSRGAYTARCISGFIAWAGILQKCAARPMVDGRAVNESVFFNEIFEAYSKREPDNPESIRKAAQVLHDKVGRWPSTGADAVSTPAKMGPNGSSDQVGTASVKNTLLAEDGAPLDDEVTVPPQVKVLGVWDTVGALGIPGFFPQSKLYQFLDPGLSSNVSYAFQALALGEDRRDFMPTLWYKPWPSQEEARRKGQVLKKVWFNGAHSSVGGSNEYHGLSDIALAWMVAQLLDTHAPEEPLVDVDVAILRSLQDRRYAWAKEPPKPSRSFIEWQETRQIRDKPEADESQKQDWRDNVYTGVTNESIHHSVVVSGLYDKETSPQFAELRAAHPELLDQMWKAASDANSLSPTERLLKWDGPDAGQAPPQPPKNAIVRGLLKAVAASSTAVVTVVSDAINLRVIPAREQVNLKVALAQWAKRKLRGGP